MSARTIARGRTAATVPARPAAGVLGTLRAWTERWRHRARLLELDDRMLRDVGLSRADVELEASKPFWTP
jgi:uncharacterized protein YjiS (DUF1127 family)